MAAWDAGLAVREERRSSRDLAVHLPWESGGIGSPAAVLSAPMAVLREEREILGCDKWKQTFGRRKDAARRGRRPLSSVTRRRKTVRV